jgi:type I restriction enzyme S subunit
VYWSETDFYPIDTVYFIGAEQSTLYLYYALANTQFISTDVAVPGLNRDFAHSRKMLVPTRKLASVFDETVVPMHRQIQTLRRFNAVLARARDLLLPRLMSGEIAV